MSIQDALKKDGALFAFIGGFAVAVTVVAVSVGQLDNVIPFVYIARWLDRLLAIASAVVAWVGLQSVRDPNPLARFRSDLRRIFDPERVAGLTLFGAIAIHHGMFTSAKTILPHLTPFRLDPVLSRLDAAIHGDDPWKYLTFLDPITRMVQFTYGYPWFTCVALFSLAACVLKSWRPVREQFLWTFVIAWALFGTVLAGVFMSGGPIFYEPLHGDLRYAELTSHLRSVSGASGLTYPDMLWTAYRNDIAGLGTGISAFPSLHVSMATLFFLTARRLNKWFGFVMLAFLAFVMIGSVHLAWHYAVDGYASLLLTVGLWTAVGWALRRRQPSTELKTQPWRWRSSPSETQA